MKSIKEIGSTLTSIVQLHYASEAMLMGTLLICLAKVGENEGCTRYFQTTLIHGGLFLASASGLIFVLASASDIATAFAHLNRHCLLCQLSQVRLITWVCFFASVANYFAPYRMDDRYHTDIILTVILLLIVLVTVWYDHKSKGTEHDK